MLDHCTFPRGMIMPSFWYDPPSSRRIPGAMSVQPRDVGEAGSRSAPDDPMSTCDDEGAAKSIGFGYY